MPLRPASQAPPINGRECAPPAVDAGVDAGSKRKRPAGEHHAARAIRQPAHPLASGALGSASLEAKVRQLAAMGFAEHDCRAMLELAGGQLEAAARLLAG